MVFEQFLTSDKVKKHALYIFLLGIFYVIIGYFVSGYFFSEAVSVATMFTTTLLLVPSIYVILNIEEKVESKAGIKRFFHNHKDIFKMYFSLFKGIFVAFLILGFFSTDVFDYQLDFLENRGDIGSDIITEFTQNEYTPTFSDFTALISHNLFVIILCFILSIFYGAGALFLIVLNASVFAGFIVHVVKTAGNSISTLLLFLIHLIPELSGFLIAAIAGGVISRAIMKEKFGSKGFQNVMKDALILLLISAGLIIIAAFLELFVTAPLFKMLF